jgi:hypothetical protein
MDIRDEPQSAIMNIIAGYWLSQVVHLAARIRIADAIGASSAGLEEIARRTRTRPDELRRAMRALTCHGFFKQDDEGAFSQTALSETLRSDVPGSMRAILEAELGHDHYQSWADNEGCMREGGTAFERRYGMPVWRYYAQHPEMESLAGEAMSNVTKIANRAVLESYDFASFDLAVDVGGGHGAFLSAILDRYPRARGILLDLPTVVEEAAGGNTVLRHGGRLKTCASDFFEGVPTGGDLYLLKFILHDWEDDDCVSILSNIRSAMAAAGRLLVVEIVIPTESLPHLGPLLDLNMMVMTGGRERTEAEYRDLLAKSGFRLQRVVATSSPFSLIEAVHE